MSNRMPTATTYEVGTVASTDSGGLFARTMALVASTAGAFAVGVYVARDASIALGWVSIIGSIGALLALSWASRRSQRAATGILLAFGFLLGAAVAPTLAYYASVDPRTLWVSGAATALFVVGFGLIGYTTKRDLSALGRILTWALIALIAFGVLLVLAQIPSGELIYSVLSLLIFAGLTSYDFQRLRRTKDIQEAPLLAASIFLDILNIFSAFLPIGDD